MAGGGRKRNRIRPIKKPRIDSVRNEINVTPLVDVCLVLLIIFMVIMPMLARGKEVPLPEATKPAAEKDCLQPIVAIDEAGTIYLDKEEIPNRDFKLLGDRIEGAWSAAASKPSAASSSGKAVEDDCSNERKVYLKAAATLRFKEIYPVIMAIHDLGVAGVDLGTNEAKESQ